MIRVLALALSLAAAWLLWSGIYTNLLLMFGGVSCLIVIVLAWRMKVIDSESVPIQIYPGLIKYLPWLFGQMVKANYRVTRRILSPDLPIQPTLLQVPISQRTEIGRVSFANSMTLTPGTVSIRMDQKTVLVHALSELAATELLEGTMNRMVCQVEGTPPPEPTLAKAPKDGSNSQTSGDAKDV